MTNEAHLSGDELLPPGHGKAVRERADLRAAHNTVTFRTS